MSCVLSAHQLYAAMCCQSLLPTGNGSGFLAGIWFSAVFMSRSFSFAASNIPQRPTGRKVPRVFGQGGSERAEEEVALNGTCV